MKEVDASVLAEWASSTGLPSARLTAGVPILWDNGRWYVLRRTE